MKLHTLISKLKKWIKILEAKAKLLPSSFLLEETCRFISNFSQSTAEVELPGEFLMPKATTVCIMFHTCFLYENRQHCNWWNSQGNLLLWIGNRVYVINASLFNFDIVYSFVHFSLFLWFFCKCILHNMCFFKNRSDTWGFSKIVNFFLMFYTWTTSLSTITSLFGIILGFILWKR